MKKIKFTWGLDLTSPSSDSVLVGCNTLLLLVLALLLLLHCPSSAQPPDPADLVPVSWFRLPS